MWTSSRPRRGQPGGDRRTGWCSSRPAGASCLPVRRTLLVLLVWRFRHLVRVELRWVRICLVPFCCKRKGSSSADCNNVSMRDAVQVAINQRAHVLAFVSTRTIKRPNVEIIELDTPPPSLLSIIALAQWYKFLITSVMSGIEISPCQPKMRLRPCGVHTLSECRLSGSKIYMTFTKQRIDNISCIALLYVTFLLSSNYCYNNLAVIDGIFLW